MSAYAWWTGGGTAISAGVASLAFIRAENVSRRRRDGAGKAVDAAAYSRAQEIYDSAIEQLREQNKLQASQVTALTLELSAVRSRLTLLQETMLRAGVAIPPGEPTGGGHGGIP